MARPGCASSGCARLAGRSWRRSAPGRAWGSSATATGINGTVFYQYPEKTFTDRLIGSYLVVSGYDNATFDSTTGPFPIIATDTAAITVVNPAAPGGGTNPASSDDASFSVLAGAGPIPGAFDPGTTDDTDFLAGADGAIRITKAADDDALPAATPPAPARRAPGLLLG